MGFENPVKSRARGGIRKPMLKYLKVTKVSKKGKFI